MNRYFLDSAILGEKSIQLDRNDVFVVWEIGDIEDGKQAIRTSFNFSKDFSGHVNNTIVRRIVNKANFDNLIANVILRSAKWREVDAAEYLRIYACLDHKSLQLQKVKRRKRIVEIAHGMADSLPLP
jgi:hypothetical protein